MDEILWQTVQRVRGNYGPWPVPSDGCALKFLTDTAKLPPAIEDDLSLYAPPIIMPLVVPRSRANYEGTKPVTIPPKAHQLSFL